MKKSGVLSLKFSFLFGTLFLFTSCLTPAGNSYGNQNFSQSQLIQLMNRQKLIWENFAEHGNSEANQDNTIIMIAYARWLLNTNLTIEHNIRNEMNKKIKTAALQNLGTALQNTGANMRAGQIDRRTGKQIQYIDIPTNIAPSRIEIESDYSKILNDLNMQKLMLEETDKILTNDIMQETGLNSREIRNLVQPYMAKLDRQLKLP
ncbi:MAG: hypothetical protein FWC19_10210 [Treponema sp.]|nr:hypothetical protein [Treponema sp.]MCL2273161.1 hypothetical protein [Treponema sp.]